MRSTNPFILIMYVILTWLALSFASMFILGKEGLEVMVIGFYLAPVVGIIAFGLSLLFRKNWFVDHKRSTIIFGLFLIIWLALIVYYVRSLFA